MPQQHSPLAATTVVLSVLQNARSCAEVARAVLSMESRRMLPHCGGRDGKCFQCSAAGCLRLPAKLIPHVAFLGLLPQMVAGHLQALLGLVLLAHSRAGW